MLNVNALYEKSSYVKKIDTMSFDKEVMESNVPWFLHFADDQCGSYCEKNSY